MQNVNIKNYIIIILVITFINMASVSNLKGVRTRYINVLKRDIATGKDLLAISYESCDIEVNIADTTRCIKSLQVYSEKLEQQSEKLAIALDETDQEFVVQFTEEDSGLCAYAVECSIYLQQHKETLISEKEKRKDIEQVHNETKDESNTEQLVQLQRDMQTLMERQLQQQERLIESHKTKGKTSSVKLPKLDLVSFNGDKTKWIEFWDSFKCSVHENNNLSNIEKFNYLERESVWRS